MERARTVGIVAALGAGVALIAINAHDHAQEPSTDTADAVATSLALLGAALWFALRRAGTGHPAIGLVRAVAAGIAVGAVVTGLVSVVYDPWAG